jgi:hypothetical protein
MSEKYVAKYLARSSAIASRMLGGEIMIMSAVDSTFFTLNPVATVIWQADPATAELIDDAVVRDGFADHVFYVLTAAAPSGAASQRSAGRKAHLVSAAYLPS